MNYFDQLKSGGATEEYLFRKYQELDGRHADNIQKRSWFFDQVLHPYETQHTLREIVEIFREMNVKLISTSINHFDRIDDINELYREEEKLYDVGMQYLNMNKYYPGFFYVLGKKE